MHRPAALLIPFSFLVFSLACATTGPQRSTLMESVQAVGSSSGPPAAPSEVGHVNLIFEVNSTQRNSGPGMSTQREELSPEAGQALTTEDAAPTPPAAEQPAPVVETPKATPFSAGLMLGVGMHMDGSRRVIPAQLAVGSIKLADVKGRAVNALALGGISSTSIQSARAAWGVGAAFELTRGTLPYEVDAALGVLWVAGEGAPAGIFGFTLTPKM